MITYRCVTETLTLVTDCERVLAAYLERHNGKAEFPALFDLAGRLIAARLITTRRGNTSWTVLKSDNPDSQVIAWFNASQARNPEVARRHDAAHGYYVGSVLANAQVTLVSSTTHSLHAAIVRNDHGFSRKVSIVDNGHGERTGRYYGLRLQGLEVTHV